MGSSDAEIKNYLPSAPVNLQAVDITSDSAKLKWSPSADPDGSVAAYDICLSMTQGRGCEPLAKTSVTEFEAAGLAPETSYYFTVRAIDDRGGESEASGEITVRTHPFVRVNIPPEAPENLLAGSTGHDTVTLSWSRPEDPDGTVTGYNLYTITAGGPGYSLTAYSTDTECTVAGLLPDTQYIFVVRAVDNDSAESCASEEVRVQTLPAPIPPAAVFFPPDSSADVPIDAVITVAFDKPVRMPDDSDITDLNAADVIIFKEDNASGQDVSFTASINPEKTVITVSPAALLGYSRTYYAAMEASVEDNENNAAIPAHIIFTTVQEPDTCPPSVSFNPADSARGIPVDTDIIITFNEPVRLPDNRGLTGDDAAGLIVFKKDNDTGPGVNFTASVNEEKTVITVTPADTLDFNSNYYISLTEGLEDYNDNPAAEAHAVFRTLFIVINEALYDSAGSDSSVKDNFIELYGMPGLDLTGWKIICYNAPSGAYLTILFDGQSIPADGFFVIGESGTVPGCDLAWNGLELQNGPDSIRLLGPSGEPADTLGYSGSDSSGEFFFCETAPAPATGGGKSLSRNPGHLDTDNNSADFTVKETPGPGF